MLHISVSGYVSAQCVDQHGISCAMSKIFALPISWN